MLASIHPEVHAGLDHGAFKSLSYFDAEGTEVDRSLASMLVRYHAKTHLKKVFPDVGFDSLSLCGLSMLCKNLMWRGRSVNCRLRLWKSFNNELPPAESDGKRSFYTQPQIEMFPDGSPIEAEDVTELKLAILWNLDVLGHLCSLWLVAPKKINKATGEIKVYWDIQIPDPALAVAAAADSKTTTAKKDLPLTPKKRVEEQET